jgi:general secretion pathway protein K
MSSSLSRKYSKTLRRNPDRGIALISVLWVLLLLSALAATATYIARTHAILAHRALDLARAQAAADAAIVDTISKLSDEQTARHPSIGGGVGNWEFDGFTVVVSISKEAGRIDVNTASDELILAFLQSQGMSQDIASTLLDALRDRPARGLNRATGNGPLESLEELRQIPSWTAQNPGCWMDSLTVYTGLPGVDVADATPKALAALQWAQAHHLGNRDWIAAAPAAAGATATRSVFGEVLRIRATASATKDVSTTSEWVGRLTGDRQKPILTMRWEHDVPTAPSACSSIGST